MSVIVFEDQAADRLSPITTGRLAAGITCGGYRLVDWLERLEHPLRSITRRYLAEIQLHDFPQFSPAVSGGTVMLVNARAVPSLANFRLLQQLLREGRPGVARYQGQIAAAVLPPDVALPTADVTAEKMAAYFDFVAIGGWPELALPLKLFDYPHDVLRWHLEILPENLHDRLARGQFQEIADGVFAGDGVELGQYLATDSRHGPILIESDARIGPHVHLRGPVLLGRGCKVNEHSSLKDGVALGHTTKVGGEVEASIVEPYSNKQHYGFLGHSYLGSWINMGAGTCNSDLKNTYGKINMEYGGEKVATDMQFLGCIIGDYAKTAINTGIFTGKTIGVCSMVYGYVTTNVPSFVNYARLFGQVTELPLEVMEATQRRMFARRNVQQRPCDVHLLHELFELTRRERQLAGEPLSL